MDYTETLKGKKILIVDDEPDVIETLEELLDMCSLDTAASYDTAVKFMEKQRYNAAVFDIQGVRGYDLLKLAREKQIPTLMLTAHALSPEDLKKSIQTGAQAYIPKEKMAEIASYVAGIIAASARGKAAEKSWFSRLKPFFDRKFKPGWQEKDADFWRQFDQAAPPSKDELDRML